MKHYQALASAAFLFAAAASYPLHSQSIRPVVTKATVDQWMTELSNWGRWGKQDQLGAMNLITAQKRLQAVRLVREGASISLSHDTEKETAADNPSPFGHTMNVPPGGAFVMDTYSVSYHGYAHTHMDSLCHMSYQGKMYNGFPREEVTTKGAGKLAITNLKNGILSRGILMDIPRLKGVPYLEPGLAIYPEDLEAWEKKAGVKAGSGDIVLIRTGRWARRAEKGSWAASKNSAGLHASCAKWLKSRDVAILGSDAASDVMPSGVDGVVQPIHQLVLVAMGMPIFDNCDLEAISEAAQKRKRWEFMITASPLAVPGGTGSPLNPIATF
ncbi:MAG: cyclase family protein [Bryobacteraceae bacterium]